MGDLAELPSPMKAGTGLETAEVIQDQRVSGRDVVKRNK